VCVLIDYLQRSGLIAVLTIGGILALIITVGTCVIISTSEKEQLHSFNLDISQDEREKLFHWTSETRLCPFCNKLKNHDRSCPHYIVSSGDEDAQNEMTSPPPAWADYNPHYDDEDSPQINYSFHSASLPWHFDEVQKKRRKISLGTVRSMA